MSATLRITEGEPESYPQVTDPIPSTDTPVEKVVTAAWQRVESYIAHRWNSRSVEYIVEGPGEWQPRLSPTTITTTEVWSGGEWDAVTLDPDPLGGYVLENETYRFTGTLGSENEPPRAVKEAVFRLVEYFLAIKETPPKERFMKSFGYESRPDDPLGGLHNPGPDQGVNFERHNAQWIPRALQYSGAADLLRPYRKLGAA